MLIKDISFKKLCSAFSSDQFEGKIGLLFIEVVSQTALCFHWFPLTKLIRICVSYDLFLALKKILILRRGGSKINFYMKIKSWIHVLHLITKIESYITTFRFLFGILRRVFLCVSFPFLIKLLNPFGVLLYK